MSDAPLIFTHVMKTGGTSVVRAIEAAVGAGACYPRDSRARAIVAKSIPATLLDEPADSRARYRFISAHHPAWVAFAAVDDAVRVTVLRDPVERTVSHLRQLAASDTHPIGSVDEAWHDAEIRARMTDYMCQIFSDPGDTTSAGTIDPAGLDDPDAKARFVKAMADGWSTAIWTPRPVDDGALETAKATLARYDVVGVTDDLAGYVERLVAATGHRIEPPAHDNRTSEREPVGDDLLAEIGAATRRDRELYDHAVRLAAG